MTPRAAHSCFLLGVRAERATAVASLLSAARTLRIDGYPDPNALARAVARTVARTRWRGRPARRPWTARGRTASGGTSASPAPSPPPSTRRGAWPARRATRRPASCGPRSTASTSGSGPRPAPPATPSRRRCTARSASGACSSMARWRKRTCSTMPSTRYGWARRPSGPASRRAGWSALPGPPPAPLSRARPPPGRPPWAPAHQRRARPGPHGRRRRRVPPLRARPPPLRSGAAARATSSLAALQREGDERLQDAANALRALHEEGGAADVVAGRVESAALLLETALAEAEPRGSVARPPRAPA